MPVIAEWGLPMGDISAEPSMEEILSSIKRIIAEEGEAPGRGARRAPRVAAPPEPVDEADGDSILELNEPMAPPRNAAPQPPAPPPVQPTPAPQPVAAPQPAPAPAEPIVSRHTAEATRGSLDTLSRLLVKPDQGSDGTLEGLVREMLRPMLREWLDTNLPPLVEEMVAGEIAKITGQRG